MAGWLQDVGESGVGSGEWECGDGGILPGLGSVEGMRRARARAAGERGVVVCDGDGSGMASVSCAAVC